MVLDQGISPVTFSGGQRGLHSCNLHPVSTLKRPAPMPLMPSHAATELDDVPSNNIPCNQLVFSASPLMSISSCLPSCSGQHHKARGSTAPWQ